ncbi:MAG: hypothetical protein ACREIP_22330 [Alphaproteobacteria bacterium]
MKRFMFVEAMRASDGAQSGLSFTSVSPGFERRICVADARRATGPGDAALPGTHAGGDFNRASS